MSCSNDCSVQQADSAKSPLVENIIERLENLSGLLKKGPKFDVREGTEVGAKWSEMKAQFEQVRKELNFMITAFQLTFQKLKQPEANPIEGLKTLECNVDDILKDLAVSASLKQIEHNLKVLRSNITKVKIRISLQHQASNLISDANRYLPATIASKEGGDLPSLYEAGNTFANEGSYLKEFQEKYDGLQDDGLKLCLLCFAIFPENAEVRKSLLRFWWFGERLTERPGVSEEKNGMGRATERPGVSEEKSGMGRAKERPGISEEKNGMGRATKRPGVLEEKNEMVRATERPGDSEKKDEIFSVNDILRLFVEKGFIEPVKRKSRLPATSYKMHPIVRSLLIRLAKEANFFDFDSKGNPTMDYSKSKKTCLIKSEGSSLSFYKSSWQKHLVYLEELQTLFNISKQFPDFPVELFSKMRGICVLYLGRWEHTAESHIVLKSCEWLKGLKNMKKLRLLSLQFISGISKLPQSLCELINLRMLDLRACHELEELPKQIGSLKKLAYLDISECYLIDNMPKQLASLSELQVLKGFVISKNKHSCSLDMLRPLTKLKKLTINVNSNGFEIEKAGDDLSKFEALQKLSIAWGAMGEESSNGSNSGDKGKKKGHGHHERDADWSKNHKRQQNDAAKSGATAARRKLKMPWGAYGEGSSSRLVPENKESDAAKSGATKEVEFLRLVKLDLQCFPGPKPPSWLVPKSLKSLKSLYIRGGKLSDPAEIMVSNEKWEVEILRLKYLTGVQIKWKDLLTQFPKLKYLERVKCP